MSAQHESELPGMDTNEDDRSMAKQHYVHSGMPLASMVTALEIGASRFCRERHLRATLTELAAANARVKELEKGIRHYEEKPFYTRNLFENDAEMEGKEFSSVTADDFVNLFEYSEKCRCQCCAEIRYILSLREALAKGAA